MKKQNLITGILATLLLCGGALSELAFSLSTSTYFQKRNNSFPAEKNSAGF